MKYRISLSLVVAMVLTPGAISQFPEPSPGTIPTLPLLGVGNITFSDVEPLEGDLISIMVPVVSNETLPVGNVTVHFLVDQKEIGNVTGLDLEPLSETDVSIEWIAEKWTHAVTVTVDVGGQTITTAITTELIEVEAEPIGDVPTLLYLIGSILAVVVAVTLAPSFAALARR